MNQVGVVTALTGGIVRHQKGLWWLHRWHSLQFTYAFSYHHHRLPWIYYGKATQDVCESFSEGGILSLVSFSSLGSEYPFVLEPSK